MRKHSGSRFQQVQKYEKGTNRISSSKLAGISEALEVSIGWLFDGTLGRAKPPRAQVDKAIQEFMATDDGRRLALNFSRINDRDLRRSIINMAEALAASTGAALR